MRIFTVHPPDNRHFFNRMGRIQILFIRIIHIQQIVFARLEFLFAIANQYFKKDMDCYSIKMTPEKIYRGNINKKSEIPNIWNFAFFSVRNLLLNYSAALASSAAGAAGASATGAATGSAATVSAFLAALERRVRAAFLVAFSFNMFSL